MNTIGQNSSVSKSNRSHINVTSWCLKKFSMRLNFPSIQQLHSKGQWTNNRCKVMLCMLWYFDFSLLVWGLNQTISYLPKVLNFNRLFLKPHQISSIIDTNLSCLQKGQSQAFLLTLKYGSLMIVCQYFISGEISKDLVTKPQSLPSTMNLGL